jgi:hypothetical protein
MTTFGVIVGNRGFFPAELASKGREEMLCVLARLGYGAVFHNLLGNDIYIINIILAKGVSE